MLARSGRLPTGGDFAYEVKRAGFRAIVSTEGPLRVRSRRGWNVTEHVQFLVHLPVRAVPDGDVTREPYSKRRRILESTGLDGPRWRTPEAFDHGGALWQAECEHELEG